MTNDMPSGPFQDDPQPPQADAGHFPALTFNPDDYRAHLEGGDLTREQEDALLQALWLVVVGFVDLSFGVHPIQQGRADVHKRRGMLEADSARMVSCAHAFREMSDNTDAAAPDQGKAAGSEDS